jgi:cytosine/adenosine deaminase-related metal-dependent hydrolase
MALPSTAGDVRLPGRTRRVLRGATILTLDPDIGDLFDSDLAVDEQGSISQVGPALDCPGAVEVDCSGKILVPGFVDTHWHLWNSVLRGVVAGTPERSYFPVKNRLAAHYRPADSYAACRMALAEALTAGITTVTNWNHNLRSPEDATANVLAHLDSGLRGRLAYGNPNAFDPEQPMDTADVLRVRREYDGADGRFEVGLALRGPVRTTRKVLLAEWEFARHEGLSVTLHLGGKRTDTSRYADLLTMERDGLLGPDVQVVHAVDADDADIAALARTGTKVALSLVTEFPNMGIPPLGLLREAGVTTSLSIDTVAWPATADMFEQMRQTLRVERFRDPQTAVTEDTVLEMATVEGARDLGIDHLVGSLTPGKRADVVAVDARRMTMTPGVDPRRLVVLCATPADVDLVMVEGRMLVDGGRPTFFDEGEVASAARTALDAILGRAGWDPRPEVGQA